MIDVISCWLLTIDPLQYMITWSFLWSYIYCSISLALCIVLEISRCCMLTRDIWSLRQQIQVGRLASIAGCDGLIVLHAAWSQPASRALLWPVSLQVHTQVAGTFGLAKLSGAPPLPPHDTTVRHTYETAPGRRVRRHAIVSPLTNLHSACFLCVVLQVQGNRSREINDTLVWILH